MSLRFIVLLVAFMLCACNGHHKAEPTLIEQEDVGEGEDEMEGWVFLAASSCALNNPCTPADQDSYLCLNETEFRHCLANGGMIVSFCAQGSCATRTPSSQDPCVGPLRAYALDDVPPRTPCP